MRRNVEAYNEPRMRIGDPLTHCLPPIPLAMNRPISALHGDLAIGGTGTAQSLVKRLIELGSTWTNRENIDD